MKTPRSNSESTDTVALASTVKALLAPGKGILAVDESFPTIAKRFEPLKIPVTEETRRDYRQLLLTTPGLGEFISGVILFDETIRQQTSDGIPLTEILRQQGIVPGIKVDLGTADLPNYPGEKFTKGLDQLRERLAEYRTLGARFTKWRAVLSIGEGTPTGTCIKTNTTLLAMFAALSQEAGLVPIVEPEVLMDGNHDIKRAEEVTGIVLKSLFDTLADHRVAIEHTLLKTSMVLSGSDCPQQAGLAEITEATVRCLRGSVPEALPGIVFLSGGQSDEEATERLNSIAKSSTGPWTLSFSYGRALQAPSLKAWKGSAANIEKAQGLLHHRARCNGLAVQGKYDSSMD